MKKFIVGLVKLLTYFINCLSIIDLRVIVLLCGMILAVFSPRIAFFSAVDHLMLATNSALFSSPLGSADIAIVEVPPEEIEVWQSDIHASGNLTLLLSNMLSSPNTTVGIVLSQPVDIGAGLADDFIASLAATTEASEFSKSANALVGKKSILIDLLSDRRLVLGVEGGHFAGQTLVQTHADVIDQLPSFFKYALWPVCADCSRIERRAETPIDQYSISMLPEPQVSALYPSPDERFSVEFLVELLLASQGLNSEDLAGWDRENALPLGEYTIPLSTSATFIPLHALSDRLQPLVSRMALSEALARSAFPDFVFITSSANDSAMRLAEALYSIKVGSVFFSPWWQSLLSLTLMLVFSIYLAFVVVRIPLRFGALATLVILLLMIFWQTLMLHWKGHWFPLGLPVAWLLSAHLLLAVWVVKRRKTQRIVDRAEDICIRQAKSLIKTRQLELALDHLSFCSPHKAMLQTLYEISDAYAEQKNFTKAVEVLSKIHDKRKSYKDTEQKLQVLKTMLHTQKVSATGANFQKTALLSKQAENKTLGRYRLEKEIGRGAMGRVYLGFDPRISRRVAIKTLSYEQFKGKERQNIKSRFFREAEAAGRLSHPSIVSVYDVGEDGDQAYIAMDFADGDPLSSFVSVDSLLPVFEVYRIVYDVAMALEYAHTNNIVHRDVKPGNIIYNPSPYQIRVTDFGIARLTDDSKTSTGEILGSPLYMAPEQLKGKKVNRAADIFSLGVTFYQLLTGHLPYRGDNLAALTYEIIHGKHKNVRTIRKDLPASAARIINQALQKDATDRYETAAEMAIVLKKAIKRDFSVQAKRAGYI